MKHFLFEFITGGGLIGEPLTDSLVNEGTLIIKTLINELITSGNKNIVITRDERIESIDDRISQKIIHKSCENQLIEDIKKSDICWLIAPETKNHLYKLTELFIKNSNLYIGSDLKSVKLTSSKLATSLFLMNADICTPETTKLDDFIPKSKTGWIIKPDDGVGAQDCFLLQDKSEVKIYIEKGLSNYIIQPYIEGEHLSISILAYNKKIQLLSCNKQVLEIKNKSVSLSSIFVNQCLYYQNEMRELAEKIITIIPGLSGYIGIDLIKCDNKLFVIDINPRFTTSYAGISRSLNQNITKKILMTFILNEIQDVNLEKSIPIEIKL